MGQGRALGGSARFGILTECPLVQRSWAKGSRWGGGRSVRFGVLSECPPRVPISRPPAGAGALQAPRCKIPFACRRSSAFPLATSLPSLPLTQPSNYAPWAIPLHSSVANVARRRSSTGRAPSVDQQHFL
ncbi:hypothetical protein R5R35_014515 [Gryllus longicercus]|uniref:Uncharacterized protein n=1 Tax=Gryllus longicercus TaxID=2509291 RepID=A0AAN9Z7I4_9ORTH